MFLRNLLPKSQNLYYDDIEYILHNLPQLLGEEEIYTRIRKKYVKQIDVVRGIHWTDSIVNIRGIATFDDWHFNIQIDGVTYHVYVNNTVTPDAHGYPIRQWALDTTRRITE